MFSEFQPPISGFWWMLPPKQLAATQMVEQMARGNRVVYRAPEFTSSSSAAAVGIAAGSGSSQTQQLRLRQRKQPTQQGSSGRGPVAVDSSSSQERGAIKEHEARLCSEALFQSSHEQGVMDGTYSSLDDTAATRNTDAAVQDAASKLQKLCGSVQELLELQLQCSDSSCSDRASSLHQRVDQQADRLLNAANKCHAAFACPPTRQWQAACGNSVQLQPLPQDSASDCCSNTATADSDCSEDAEQAGPAPASGHHSLAAAHFRSQQQDQERRQERQLRRLQRSAATYSWYSHSGQAPLRPWQLQRSALLTRRQIMTNRVSILQHHAGLLLEACSLAFKKAAATTALAATAGEPAGQLQQPQWPHPGTDELCRVAKELLSCWQSSPSAEHQLTGLGLAMRVQIGFEDTVTVPQKGLVVPNPSTLLQHLTCFLHSPPDPDKFRAAQQLQRCWQSLVRYRQSLDQLLDEHSSDLVMLQVADEQQREREQAHGTTRQLLWEVLQQMKPAACQWYEHGAQHYQQQQQHAPAERPTAASSSTAPSSAADAKSAAASVPECCSVELWSSLAHSIASDVLLVPPGIRDMVGNGWAAGAGRLGDMGADIASSSSSSSSSAAARMLVVQYARAARRKYAQVCMASNSELTFYLCWQLWHLHVCLSRPVAAGPYDERMSLITAWEQLADRR